MRALVAMVGAAVLAACAGHDGSSVDGPTSNVAPVGTAEPVPNPKSLGSFEAQFDVSAGTATFQFKSAGGVTTQSVTIPYGASGSTGAYLHTRNTQWKPAAGAIPNAMSAGISAENLFNQSITNFTAVIDSITPPTVGVCNVTTSSSPNACATGGKASTWSCSAGSASPSSPGIAPCRLNYGTVAHTGAAGASGTTAGDNGVPLPWWFADAAAVNFSIQGHIEGDAVPAN